MDELLKNYWPQISALVIVTVWLVRIEGRQKLFESRLQTDGERMVKSMESMTEAQKHMAETIHEMQVTLATIAAYRDGLNEAKKRGSR